ncbi:hypothetical protein [uncultured Pseudoteredinibacter sp.]|uniref:hypothetical protein n=1 Tax=uncultured Pseudoteredinibacter sp. TaxID=1641701 RepID=UPI00263340B7|nr:hypothetical protein [uncultured Pseudoteredinibacter sp.]
MKTLQKSNVNQVSGGLIPIGVVIVAHVAARVAARYAARKIAAAAVTGAAGGATTAILED